MKGKNTDQEIDTSAEQKEVQRKIDEMRDEVMTDLVFAKQVNELVAEHDGKICLCPGCKHKDMVDNWLPVDPVIYAALRKFATALKEEGQPLDIIFVCAKHAHDPMLPLVAELYIKDEYEAVVVLDFEAMFGAAIEQAIGGRTVLL